MDRAVHRRWLEYLETVPYFQSPKAPRLDRDAFVVLDAEHQALAARPKTELTPEEAKRLRDLQRVLQRD